MNMHKLGLMILCIGHYFTLDAQDLSWVLSLGGSSFDRVEDMVVDEVGNLYLTGVFTGTIDFDPGTAVTELSSENSDSYVLKMNSQRELLWVRHLDGVSRSENLVSAIALDQEGNLLVCGEFTDQTDFNPGGADGIKAANARDAYLIKFSGDGEFQWVKTVDGKSETIPQSIAVDQNNDYYVTGFFDNRVDFDPGESVNEVQSLGRDDIFLQKLDSDGNLIWIQTYGSVDGDQGNFIKAHNDHLYLTGYYKNSVDFDSGDGEAILSSRAGSSDIFVQKMTLDGVHVWARTFGGESLDEGNMIDIDSEDNVIVGGDNLGEVFFSDDNSISFPNIIGAGFIMKLSSEGELTWVKAVREPAALAVDGDDQIITVGSFRNPFDFDPDEGELILEGNGNHGFIQIFTPDGQHKDILQLERISGSGATDLKTIIIDASDQIFICGSFWETLDFDPGDGLQEISSARFSDGFVMQLSSAITSTKDRTAMLFDVHVHPNPTYKTFFVSWADHYAMERIEILNALGHTVHQQLPMSPAQNQIDFPASLPPGLYVLRMVAKEGHANIKILKK